MVWKPLTLLHVIVLVYIPYTICNKSKEEEKGNSSEGNMSQAFSNLKSENAEAKFWIVSKIFVHLDLVN